MRTANIRYWNVALGKWSDWFDEELPWADDWLQRDRYQTRVFEDGIPLDGEPA